MTPVTTVVVVPSASMPANARPMRAAFFDADGNAIDLASLLSRVAFLETLVGTEDVSVAEQHNDISEAQVSEKAVPKPKAKNAKVEND